MKKLLPITFIILITSQLLMAQLSGTRIVPSENYPNFKAIVDSLNIMEINTGGITFEVSGDQVFNHSPLIISGTGDSDSPIAIIWNQTGEKPILNFTGSELSDEAGITLLGTDYFSLDGISIIVENELLEFGIFLSNASLNNGCQHNVFQNIDVALNKSNTNQTVGINVVTEDEPSLSDGIHADNKFLNNTVQNCIMGYNFNSGTGDVDFMGFDNEVGVIDDGLSLINDISLCGVYLKGQNGAKVHHTQISNLERIGTGNTAPAAIATTSSLPSEALTGQFEIHDNIIDNHHSGITSIFGFYLNARKSDHLIFNNIINNISATGGGTNSATGIMVFGTDINATIYNNMISEIASPASYISGLPGTRGIELRKFSEAQIYYNSIQINYVATNIQNSSAALVVNNDENPITLKNNIFINTSILEGQSTGVATAFFNSATTVSNITNQTTNNLYYCGEPSINHPIYYGYSSSAPVIGETLEDYQSLAINFDQTAFSGQVEFINDTFLYVQITDPLIRENAVPLFVTEDIDGQARNLTNPDLGADELAELNPNVAVNPSPEDLSTDIPVNQVLISWNYYDSDLFAIPAGFKIYLNDSEDFSGVSYFWLDYEEVENFSVEIADILALENNTSYYWKVIPTAMDQNGPEAEDVQIWSFTTTATIFDYPNLSECVSPLDGAVTVDVDLEMLSWSYVLNSDYTVPFGFRVYFGINSDFSDEDLLPFTNFQSDEDDYSISLSEIVLDSETTYYWKVVPVAESETGAENQNAETWQFTTEQNTAISSINNIKLSISPNPVSDFVSVHFIKKCELNIFNLTGEIVLTIPKQESPVNLDLSNMKSGVYFLVIQNKEEVITERFVVK